LVHTAIFKDTTIWWWDITFFNAFLNEFSESIENTIRNISVLGYANCLNVLYYSCPAVSHRPKLTNWPFILRVVVKLSKTVG